LMAVSSAAWLAYDLFALVAFFGLYYLHALKFDKFEVNDYNTLVELLGDDGSRILQHAPKPVENPNRWIQAMSYTKTYLRACLPSIYLILYLLFVISAWIGVVGCWSESDLSVLTALCPDPETAQLEHAVTLLLVGTLMLMCHLVFELMYWRETQFCMPPNADGAPWSLKEDGVPSGFFCRIFGLPCIWFTSRKAYDDLCIWVTLASGEKTSRGNRQARSQSIWPTIVFEELALYALQDVTKAARLRHSLLQSKLFDKRTDAFLRRAEGSDNNTPYVEVSGLARQYASSGKAGFHKVNIPAGDCPAELELDLLFYDQRSGVYWAPDSSEEHVFKDKIQSNQLRPSNTMTTIVGSGSSLNMESISPRIQNV